MISLKHWPAISLAAGLAAVVILATFTYCHAEPTAMSRANQKSIDSLDATKPAFRAAVDTIIKRESVFVRESAINRGGAIKSAHAADSLRDVAIAWERAALAQNDTSSRWYEVAKVRGQENDSLRVANSGLLASLEEQTQARTSADARAALDSSRLAATERLNANLARDLAQADPPCHVLPFVTCPSRTVVAMAAAATGYALSRPDVRSAARKIVTAPFSLLTK